MILSGHHAQEIKAYREGDVRLFVRMQITIKKQLE
jgi:hypothetical protein